MFILRKEHKSLLGEASFLERLYSHLLRYYPATMAHLEPSAARVRMRIALKRARVYGLWDERSLTMFVSYAFAFSPTFDEAPAVKQVLGDQRIATTQRMVELLYALDDADWTQLDVGDTEPLWYRLLTQAMMANGR